MKAVVCIAGITAGGRLVVRPLYRRISALNNSDVFAATTLLVVLGTSVLTQAAGLSLALGAFLVSPCPLSKRLPPFNQAHTGGWPVPGTRRLPDQPWPADPATFNALPCRCQSTVCQVPL